MKGRFGVPDFGRSHARGRGRANRLPGRRVPVPGVEPDLTGTSGSASGFPTSISDPLAGPGRVDRLFQNFPAAGGNPHKPLGLGGSGEVSGHIAKSWSDPEVTAQVAAESARFADVLFGSVRGSADMHDGAFLFHPLRVYEGEATVSLEGASRFRSDPKRPDLDLTLTAKGYPVERFLDFLDLDYPITGRVTGSFPLSGNPPDAVSGEGLAVIEDAVLWGQKVERVTGRLGLTPGHVSFEDVRAELQGGAAGGRASLAYKDKTFEVRAAGDGIALSSIRACGAPKDVQGRLSFEVSGSGSLEKPDLNLSASLANAPSSASDPGRRGAETRPA